MRVRRLAGLTAVALILSGGCSLVTELDSLAPPESPAGDAAVTPEAAPGGFLLAATPAHVTLDPKDSTDVSIAITRGQGFVDIVDLTVNDVGKLTGLATSPATLTFTGDSPVSLHLVAAADAPTPQEGSITLLGIGRTTQKSFSTSFAVRVGSVLLDTTSSTTFSVPPWASSLSMKAWGAGGGSATGYSDSQPSYQPGGSGGWGGLAGAVFSGQGNATLTITVGAPGGSPSLGRAGGGGGGGHTLISSGANVLLVAGGGGGGGGAYGAFSQCYATPGASGSSGGGAGGNGPNSASTTAPGTGGDSSATAGASFRGGDGAAFGMNNRLVSDGGAPGGGAGGREFGCSPAQGGGGGGGSGYFGGGGGGAAGSKAGGGGGSGFVADGGLDAIAQSGAAIASDPDYKPGTATGGVCSPDGMAAGTPSTGGRVLIRASKP